MKYYLVIFIKKYNIMKIKRSDDFLLTEKVDEVEIKTVKALIRLSFNKIISHYNDIKNDENSKTINDTILNINKMQEQLNLL